MQSVERVDSGQAGRPATLTQLRKLLLLRAGQPIRSAIIGVGLAIQFRRHGSEICSSFANCAIGFSRCGPKPPPAAGTLQGVEQA